MINYIKIVNFQSISNLVLELDKVNLIRGDSDIGKSAILRAVNCLLTGSFPEYYIKAGYITSSIEIISGSDSVKYQRSRGKSPIYNVNGSIFTKLGRNSIPSQVFEVVSDPFIHIDNTLKKSINIQAQHDQMFLLQKTSSSEVAKVIGFVSKLNEVFILLKNMNTDIRDSKSAYSFKVSSKEKADALINRFCGLDSLEDSVSKVEDLNVELNGLNKFLEDTIQYESEFEKLSSLDFNKVDFDNLDTLINKISTIEDLFKRYLRLVDLKSIHLIDFDFESLEKALLYINSVGSVVDLYNSYDVFYEISSSLDESLYSKWISITEIVSLYKEYSKLAYSLLELKEPDEILIEYDLILETYSKLQVLTTLVDDYEANELRVSKDNYFKLIEESNVCPLIEDSFKESCVKALRRVGG